MGNSRNLGEGAMNAYDQNALYKYTKFLKNKNYNLSRSVMTHALNSSTPETEAVDL